MGAVVVAHAGVQALLVLGDPVPGTTPYVVLLGAASGVAAVLALIAVTLLLVAPSRPVPVLATSVGIVLVALGGMSVSPAVTAVVLVAAGAVLPAVALGPSPGCRLGRAVRGCPLAWCGWVGTAVVLLVLSWTVALLAGLLLTGPVAALVTWLVAGAAAGAVLGAARQLLLPWSVTPLERGAAAREPPGVA